MGDIGTLLYEFCTWDMRGGSGVDANSDLFCSGKRPEVCVPVQEQWMPTGGWVVGVGGLMGGVSGVGGGGVRGAECCGD